MYNEAISYYVGREVVSGVDYTLQDNSDGLGIHFVLWNILDKPQPSMQDINSIINNISFAVQFQEIRKDVTNAQLVKQKEPTLLANKYMLDCSDDTLDLLNKARQALLGSGKTETRLIDYQGNPNYISLDDIDLILGNSDKQIVGEIPLIRLSLHEQEMNILEKVLQGQPYEILFT